MATYEVGDAVYEIPDTATPEQVNSILQTLTSVPTQAQPSALEQDVQRQLGLDPSVVKRGTLVPVGETAEGETVAAVPEIVLDVARALLLPGQVASGVPFSSEDITKAALAFSPGALRGASAFRKQAIDPQQTARAARFEEQGIPATRGDISQQFAQQAEEARLVSSAVGDVGEPIRQFRLEQSQAFTAKAEELVESLGVPQQTGDTIKDALSGRKTLLRQEKNQLYKEVAEVSPEIANAPIITDDIAKALPSNETLEDIAIVGANVEGIQKALIRFGVNKNPAEVEAFVAGGGTITPLTLGNFDRFRKILGGLEKADQTGSASVAIGPLRRALDEEATFIDDAIREAGITDDSVIKTLKEARARVRTLKTEFSPQSVTGRLIDVKRDGVTPIVEASKVSQELLRPNAPIENLQRTLGSLRRSGKKGKLAIGDLQASVVTDALETALKSPSVKTSGIETIGGNQFAKALSKFGDDKLKELFKDNPKALDRLLNLKQTALDITPTAGAVPRGSAPVILDILNKAGRVPGLAAIKDMVNLVVKAGSDERALTRAFNKNPKMRRTLLGLRRNFPTLTERLGIRTAFGSEEGQQQTSTPSGPLPISEQLKQTI